MRFNIKFNQSGSGTLTVPMSSDRFLIRNAGARKNRGSSKGRNRNSSTNNRQFTCNCAYQLHGFFLFFSFCNGGKWATSSTCLPAATQQQNQRIKEYYKNKYVLCGRLPNARSQSQIRRIDENLSLSHLSRLKQIENYLSDPDSKTVNHKLYAD